MKKLLLLISIVFVLSCSSNEDNSKENSPFSLVGNWTNYKRSRQRLNSDLPPVLTTCGTSGSGFYCDIITTFYADGTAKTQPDGSVWTYSYVDGIYKSNGTDHPFKVISKDEFSTSSIVTLQDVRYETTFFYKRK